MIIALQIQLNSFESGAAVCYDFMIFNSFRLSNEASKKWTTKISLFIQRLNHVFVQFDLQIEDKISWLLKMLMVGDLKAVWFW